MILDTHTRFKIFMLCLPGKTHAVGLVTRRGLYCLLNLSTHHFWLLECEDCVWSCWEEEHCFPMGHFQESWLFAFGGDRYVSSLDRGDGFTRAHIRQNVKLYTVNTGTLLSVNYSSVTKYVGSISTLPHNSLSCPVGEHDDYKKKCTPGAQECKGPSRSPQTQAPPYPHPSEMVLRTKLERGKGDVDLQFYFWNFKRGLWLQNRICGKQNQTEEAFLGSRNTKHTLPIYPQSKMLLQQEGVSYSRLSRGSKNFFFFFSFIRPLIELGPTPCTRLLGFKD